MQTPEKVIHRIATPAAVTSHLPLRKQNQDLLEKRSTETSELRQQIRELKVALEQATQERSDLQVELFEHTQALKVSFNEQERKLRQAKVDRMLSLQPRRRCASATSASRCGCTPTRWTTRRQPRLSPRSSRRTRAPPRGRSGARRAARHSVVLSYYLLAHADRTRTKL